LVVVQVLPMLVVQEFPVVLVEVVEVLQEEKESIHQHLHQY